MDDARFEQMVARLERESVEHPRAYQAKVALLALLGLAVLGLIVGVAGLGLVILVGIALATLFTGGKAILLLIKLGKLLLLLALPMWHLVRGAMRALFLRLPAPEGLPLQRAEAPALFAAMDQMRRRMKGPRFHHVLITDEVNAAVVQRPLLGLIGFPRNYLILGLPLLESLSPDEALAVVAHEYGHLAGSHSRFSAFIYRLRLSWNGIQEIGQQWQGWSGQFLQRIVGWYAPYFNAYTFVLARANEYEADRASADLVGADVAARALKRVNLAAPQYQAFIQTTLKRIRHDPTPPADLARQWSTTALVAPPASEAQGWLQTALDRSAATHDTHPVLALRLRALPGEAERVRELPPPAEQSAAMVWLGARADLLRQQMSEKWHDRLQSAWTTRHAELAQDAVRLAELSAVSEPNIEQRRERLRLQSQLQEGFDAVSAYAQFNAEHPDDAAGLFAEGSARLDQGDEQGVALLDRAMALDAAAILPACETVCAYLNARQDGRAKDYAKRWHERQLFENQRAHEFNMLDPAHALQAVDLPAEELQQIRALLEQRGEGVARAYLARRVLPSDANIPTYVLGLQLTPWARLRKRQHEIVNRMAAGEAPVHVIIFVLEGRNKKMRAVLERIGDARLR